jgi:hypothetical protein
VLMMVGDGGGWECNTSFGWCYPSSADVRYVVACNERERERERVNDVGNHNQPTNNWLAMTQEHLLCNNKSTLVEMGHLSKYIMSSVIYWWWCLSMSVDCHERLQVMCWCSQSPITHHIVMSGATELVVIPTNCIGDTTFGQPAC